MLDVSQDLRAQVAAALAEDAPTGDLTTALTVDLAATCKAELRAKAEGVLSGSAAAQAAFDVAADQDGLGLVAIEWVCGDGDHVLPADVIAQIQGPARTVLRAERVAINFMSHLSGVATLTSAFVRAAAPARVLCTRKTTPGLRALERQAVADGGGSLHRASLSDAILIKDNHLRASGGLSEAVTRARAGGVPAEVEVDTLEQLEEAIQAGADSILLDNPSPDLVRTAEEKLG